MKITPEHYAHMLEACKTSIHLIAPRVSYVKRESIVPNIDKTRDVEQRYRWDLMDAAGLSPYVCEHVYKYANDTHIDTALKQIVKELNL